MGNRGYNTAIREGAAFVRGLADLNNLQGQVEDQARQQQTLDYGQRMEKGETIAPTEDGYDYAAHHEASAMKMKALMDDQRFMGLKLANDTQTVEKEQQEIDQLIGVANGHEQNGDADKAYDTLAQIYSYVPDGNEFKGFKPGSDRQIMLMEDKFGMAYEQPAIPFSKAKTMAANVSKTHRAARMKQIEFETEKNAAALGQREYHKTKEGKEALYTYFLDNGKMRQTWRDPKTGEVLKGFDEATGEMIGPTKDNDFRPTAQWEQESVQTRRSEMTRQADERLGHDKNVLAQRKIDAKKSKTKTDATAKQKAWKADLDLVLKGFAKGKDITTWSEADGEKLTPGAKNALDDANRLITKHQNKEELTAEEKRLVKNAYKAVAIYKKISDSISSAYLTGKEDWRTYRRPGKQDETQ